MEIFRNFAPNLLYSNYKIFRFLQFFLLKHGRSTPAVSTTLTLLAGMLLIGYAVRSGNRNLPHVYVFFLTEEHELFYVDARSQQRAHTDGVLGAMEIYAKADKMLQKIKSTNEIPKSARKILWVKSIRERQRDVSVVCRVQTQQGTNLDETLFISYEVPDVQSLLLQLESENVPQDKKPRWIKTFFVCLLALFFSLALVFFVFSAILIRLICRIDFTILPWHLR